MLTQSRLKELLHYSPDTGLFTWVKARRGVSVGKVTGYLRKDGYFEIGLDRKLYLAHRLAFLYMIGEMPEEVDHADGDPSNNRWDNLISCSRPKNMRNLGIRTDNKSGIIGVGWATKPGKWIAQIRVSGKQVNLGYFHDFFEACCRRRAAENRYGFHENHGRRDSYVQRVAE